MLVSHVNASLHEYLLYFNFHEVWNMFMLLKIKWSCWLQFLGEYDITQWFCHAIQESSSEFCIFKIQKL